jgi:spore germination protein YaaH
MAEVLREITRGEEVFFIEDEGEWRKIATLDGFIGYVRDYAIGDIRVEISNRDFEEPVFTRIVREGYLNVGWDDLNSIYDNARVLETINRTQGMTAIAPMWLSIADTNGNVDSIATIEYVQTAHQAGLEVWVTLRDFLGGISSYTETYEVLSRTSSRRQIIDQTIAETLRLGADGINLDLELVPYEAGSHFIQFVREMSVEARINGLVLSTANYYPVPWRLHMNLAEQARVVDYVMLMGYDEHYAGGRNAGPVASFDFVREGIENALKQVPADMLVNALPFFSRLWYEVPMTEEEILAGDGRTNHISSVALGMNMSMSVMENSGVEITWDPVTRMYYAQWTDPYGSFRWWLESTGVHTGGLLPPSGGTYRMWLEDERSLREKLQVMRDNNLAGVASWRLGLENTSVWELIGEFF